MCAKKNRLERGGLPSPLFLSKVMNYYGDEKRRDLYGRNGRESVGGIGWIGVAAKKSFRGIRREKQEPIFGPLPVERMDRSL